MELRFECEVPEDYALGPFYKVKVWDGPLPEYDHELVITEDSTGKWLVDRKTLVGDHFDSNIDYTGSLIITQISHGWEISFMATIERGFVRHISENKRVKI